MASVCRGIAAFKSQKGTGDNPGEVCKMLASLMVRRRAPEQAELWRGRREWCNIEERRLRTMLYIAGRTMRPQLSLIPRDAAKSRSLRMRSARMRLRNRENGERHRERSGNVEPSGFDRRSVFACLS